MAISSGSTGISSDFVGTPSGSSDSGKVAKLDSNGKLAAGFLRFGGNGVDGALSISSGTTTLNLSSAQVYIKNYTSISITGTALLNFSNPHANGTTVVLKSQNNVTLTSSATPMIDASGLGSVGGLGYVTGTGGGNGPDGSIATSFSLFEAKPGQGGRSSGTNSTTGALPATFTLSSQKLLSTLLAFKYPNLFCGAGGGAGGAAGGGIGTCQAGDGGRGGGCLVIECGGAWNFTTTNGISVAGKNGTSAVSTNTNNSHTCAGGGGAAGFLLAIYNMLTSNSGSVNVSGGVKGTTDLFAGSSADASVGAGGSNIFNQGTDGVHSTGTSTGGTGATGLSLIVPNTEFAS